MKVAFYTLGCKTNQFETQALERLFDLHGHEVVPFDDIADAYIINTCTVTNTADKKSRMAAKRARKANPQGIVALIGCFAQVDEEGAKSTAGADIIFGTRDKGRILPLIETAHRERGGKNDAPLQRESPELPPNHTPADGGSAPTGSGTPALALRPPLLPALPPDDAPDPYPLKAGSLQGRTRALLKVQDGCCNYCAYCIIPYARPKLWSLPLEDAALEAAALQKEGYQEIVITGIEISSYGIDLEGRPPLFKLIQTVCQNAKGCRVRLGSLEPGTVTPEFIEGIKGLSNLCPHFHLSLQSGCDKTLKNMNRRYDTARFTQSLALLRAAFPGCAVTTDLIVGFPGETEEDFQLSLAYLQQCRFSRVHVFPYSKRKGTPASTAKDQVPDEVKKLRAKAAAALAQELSEQYMQSLLGQTLSVLFEVQKGRCISGHCTQYCEVRAYSDHIPKQPVDVCAVSYKDGVIWGEILSSPE